MNNKLSFEFYAVFGSDKAEQIDVAEQSIVMLQSKQRQSSLL